MGAGGFFTGLLGGLGAGMLDKKQRELKRQTDEANAQREILAKLIADPSVSQTAKVLALQGVMAPTESRKGTGGKGTRKGSAEVGGVPSLSEILEKIKGMPTQSREVRTGMKTETLPPLPEAPGKVTVSQPVISEVPGLFRSQKEMTQEEVQRQQALEQAKFSEQQRQAGAILGAPEAERPIRAAAAGISLPDLKPYTVFASAIPGNNLPGDALMPNGQPVPPELRTDKHHFSIVKIGGKDYYSPRTEASSARENQFSTFLKAKADAKGSDLTPQETEKAVKEFKQMGQQPYGEFVRRTEFKEDVRSEADAKRMLRKRVDVFTDSQRRLAIMEHALANPNPQNDVALLFNHIGMTLSAQRGARITNAEIHRAITARAIPSELQVLYQKVTTGQFLTPEQRQQMVSLAREGVTQSRQDIVSESESLGIPLEKFAPGLKASGASTVKMKTPDGRVWDVPSDKASEAEKRGATRVQ